MNYGSWVFIFLMTISFSNFASAQEAEYEPELKSIDTELENQMPKEVPKPNVKGETYKTIPTVNYSDVKSSVAYSDLAIVQKNFMPKSNRWQAFGALTLAPNDVFYRTMGAQARFGYHFTETWGIELTTIFLSSSKTEEINDLESKQRISVENLVTPKNYFGVNLYFNSIYGKAAFSERAIIPFEIYQCVGIGKVTTANTSNASGIFFGVGDIFSISRNGAWRVDLSMLIYQSTNIRGENQTSNTLFLSFGYGHFFPGVGRR